MNKLKTSIFLIIIGNILYLLYIYLSNKVSSINDFILGILLGISIATNLLGIIFTANYIKKESKVQK